MLKISVNSEALNLEGFIGNLKLENCYVSNQYNHEHNLLIC